MVKLGVAWNNRTPVSVNSCTGFMLYLYQGPRWMGKIFS